MGWGHIFSIASCNNLGGKDGWNNLGVTHGEDKTEQNYKMRIGATGLLEQAKCGCQVGAGFKYTGLVNQCSIEEWHTLLLILNLFGVLIQRLPS